MMPQLDERMFCLPPVDLSYYGLLFDMDGTIIDSTDAIGISFLRPRACKSYADLKRLLK